MRNFTIVLLLVFVASIVHSQECSDLFISEVIFGVSTNNVENEENSKDYTVEIFNPTDGSLDLGQYSIDLVDENDNTTSIRLQGILNSGDTHVISHSNSRNDIRLLSNSLSENLDFNAKVSLQLVSGSTVIDKIGNEGISTPLSEIDLDRLQTDPNYVNEIVINLGSIRGIGLRRSVLARNGVTEFTIIQVLTDWSIYTSYTIDNLGIHVCTCLTPVLYFDDIDPTVLMNEPEEETRESQEAFMPGVIKISEPFPPVPDDPITFELLNVPHQYIDPFAFTAFEDVDYEANGLAGQTLQISDYDSGGYLFSAWQVLSDDIGEEDEGTAFEIINFSNGGTDVALDNDRKLWEVLIYEEQNTSVHDIKTDIDLKIYPTLFDDNINVEFSNISESKLSLKSIEIYNVYGMLVSNISSFQKFEHQLNLELADITTRGTYFIRFNFEDGYISKKIFKL